MPKPRTPTAILEATGAFKHDPQRKAARAGEPAPNGPIGDPPERISDLERELWYELLDTFHPGVVCRADRTMLELTVYLLARKVKGEATHSEIVTLGQFLRLFGASPSDRSKVSAATPDKSDAEPRTPFERLMAKRKALEVQ